MFMDTIDLKKENLLLRQFGKFKFEVASKVEDEVTFARSFYLSEPLDSMVSSLSNDGLLFVSANENCSPEDLNDLQQVVLPYDVISDKEDMSLISVNKQESQMPTLSTTASIHDACLQNNFNDFMISIDSIIKEYCPEKLDSLSAQEKFKLYEELKSDYPHDMIQAIFIKQHDSLFQVSYFVLNI